MLGRGGLLASFTEVRERNPTPFLPLRVAEQPVVPAFRTFMPFAYYEQCALGERDRIGVLAGMASDDAALPGFHVRLLQVASTLIRATRLRCPSHSGGRSAASLCPGATLQPIDCLRPPCACSRSRSISGASKLSCFFYSLERVPSKARQSRTALGHSPRPIWSRTPLRLFGLHCSMGRCLCE